MTNPSYGAGKGELDDLIARAQQAEAAERRLQEVEERRRGAEERTTTVERTAMGTRSDLAAVTRELASAISATSTALTDEIGSIGANTAAWLANAEARRAASTGAATTRGAAPTVTRGAAAAPSAASTAAAEREAQQLRLRAMEAENAAMAATARAPVSAPFTPMRYAGRWASELSPAEAANYLAVSGSPTAGMVPTATPMLRSAGYGSRIRTNDPWYGTASGGGPSETIKPPSAEMAAYRREVMANEEGVARMRATQAAANREFQSAAATYSGASTALSRHGAMTTEFIQAFARGQVTLKEFESQMVSTMGKFGGWVVAGAAIYGVWEMLKHLRDGATETQAALQNLGRFIPGLGGPAGGGSGQIPYAENQLRNISTQFNMPIEQVAQPMQIAARIGPSYHNVTEASDATRAILAAVRLDNVPLEEAERYFTGIAHALNITHGSGLINVIDSLNQLQASYGARVTETLPAVTRAAPAAIAMGLPTPELEAIAAMGVRAGVTGPQVGTMLYRSMTNFAFRPSSEMIFRQYGIKPQVGEYGDLMGQVMNLIDSGRQRGTIGGTDLRNLAIALAGPQQARSMLPLLTQEFTQPGTFARGLSLAQRPRSFQEDLDAMLGSMRERFHSIGIAMENFGSRLFSAGATLPVTAFLDALRIGAQSIESFVSPLTDVLSVINELPAPMRDMLGVMIAFRGARMLYDSAFGANARGFVARLPGMEDVRNRPADVVLGAQTRMERDVLPRLEQARDRATGRWVDAESLVQRRRTGLEEFVGANQSAARMPLDSKDRQDYESGVRDRLSGVGRAEKATVAAQQEAAEAVQQVAQTEAELAVLKNNHLSWEDRALFAAKRGAVAQEATADVQEAMLARMTQQFEAITGSPYVTTGRRAARPAPGTAEEGAAGGGGTVAAAALAGAAAASQVTANVVPRAVATATDTLRRGSGLEVTRYLSQYDPSRPYRTMALAGLEGSGLPRAWAGTRDWFRERYGDVQGGPGAYAQRTGQLAFNRTREMATSLAGSPWAPVAGMMGATMLGDTIGGGAGSFISGYGGTAFSGMMIAQMLRKNMGAGFLVGGTMGAFQQSTQSGVGSLVGTGLGALLGTAVGNPMIGAAIGNVLGSTVGQLFSTPPPSPRDVQAQAQRMANTLLKTDDQGKVRDQIDMMMQMGSGAMSTLPGSDGEVKIDNSTAQKAQAAVTSYVNTAVAQVQIYSQMSRQGRDAQKHLDTVINAAVSQAATDPAAAQQMLQSATQPREQLVQQRFQAALQSGGGTGLTAYQGAAQQYAQIDEAYGSAVDQAANNLQGARETLAQAQRRGNQRTIQQAQKAVREAEDQYGAATGLRDASQQAHGLANQANAAAGYQADMSGVQARGQMAVAQAGGNRMAQLRAQSSTIWNEDWTLWQHAANLPGSQVQQETARIMAEREQNRQQLIQQQVVEMTARSGVTAAKVPSYDAAGQAKARLTALQSQYDFMKQHKDAFDPADINNALAAVITAKQAVADAVAQYNTQMAQVGGQIAAARDVGDAVAQAGDTLRADAEALRQARGPLAQAQARAQFIQQQNAVYDAVTQRANAGYQLSQALAYGDSQAQAQFQIAQGRYDLGRARGPEEANAARQMIAQGQSALNGAIMGRIQAMGQLAQAQAAGDPIRQAQIAMVSARQALANAHGIDQQIQAETALAQAQWSFHQAQEQLIQEQTSLAVSRTRDPLAALRIQIQGAQRLLLAARGPQEHMQAQTNLNDLRNRYEGEMVSQRESTIDFQLNMQMITTQQAINMYEGLLRLKNLTTQERQQILQRVRQLQMGDSSGGQFDLAPGNIKMPTVYDVSRAMRGAGGALQAGSSLIHAPMENQINVYVGNNADVGLVADAIDRTTGSQLRARLRAAGVR